MRGNNHTKESRSTRRQRRSSLIINALTLIVLVLVVFEGKSLIRLFSRQPIQERIREEEQEVFQSAHLLSTETETDSPEETQSEPETQADTSAAKPSPENPSKGQSEAAMQSGRENGIPDGGAEYMDIVVPEQAVPLEDSYFNDAVFIGDSRMQGFRNYSGITGGNFVTAVGMELENFYTDAQIPTAQGNMLAMDALKNMNFTKIYMMLGTNELGAYDMSQVKESYRKVLSDIKTRSSAVNPTVYVYSVVYVEEALVTTGDYVNNQNVDAINLQLLEMCKEEGYHYINLNEILSDGYHSLISGAAEDGIHLSQAYCQKWLEYTKTHYIPVV